jgi:N-acetylglucosaminyl-diphospho-decaprenol L-rhamnosyltransferase
VAEHTEAGAGAALELVIVTYFSRDLVADLLASLPQDVPVVIADNSQGADGVADLVVDRPRGRYLTGAGQGFAKAANLAARTSTQPYLVFVNPDTRPAYEQLTTLVEDLVEDHTLGAVAATTVAPDGRVELGVGGWEPTVARTLVYSSGLHSRLPRAGLYARPEPFEPIDLDWLTGACMAVPRDRFLSLGGFDESFFLYNEDMAYGRRLREAGLRQRLRTDVLIPHAGAGSGGSKEAMLQMRGSSMVTYLRRHNSPAAVAAMRLTLSAGALGRTLISRLRSHKDAARGFVAYNRGLWRGAPDMGQDMPPTDP